MDYDIEDLMEIGEELTDNSSDDEEDVNDGDKCQLCIARVTRRKRHMKFIGDLIFSVLFRSCNRCPARQQCRKHFKSSKARFDTHINKICPKQVCIRMGFCNKSIVLNQIETESIDNSNSTCILCDYVMNILSNYIHSQSTEEEIEENLEKICNEIPSVLQNQCQEYIDNYSPAIISILLQEFNLSTICQKLNLCTNQMKYDITYIIEANTSTCGICDYISTYIHFALQRNSNEKSFQYALSTVCTHLSDEQSPKCQTIIQLFAPFIQQLELNPGNNFCKQLTICQTPMIDLVPGISIETEPSIIDEILGQDENPHETPECTVCQYVIAYLDAALKNNKSEKAIEEALKKVCTILPGKFN
jgi:saposin